MVFVRSEICFSCLRVSECPAERSVEVFRPYQVVCLSDLIGSLL
jgi:hypothetical protein